MLAAQKTVECANCDALGVADYVSAAVLVVAMGALLIALREHRIFMRRENARAEFHVTVETFGAEEDGTLRTAGSGGHAYVHIGIKNTGAKAAGETLLNVLSPAGVRVRWSPEGDYRDPEPTDETLRRPDGRELEARYLSRTVPRINRRPHYLYKVAVPFTLPDVGSSREFAEIPLRVRIQSDELPDELPDGEYVIDHLVRVGRADTP